MKEPTVVWTHDCKIPSEEDEDLMTGRTQTIRAVLVDSDRKVIFELLAGEDSMGIPRWGEYGYTPREFCLHSALVITRTENLTRRMSEAIDEVRDLGHTVTLMKEAIERTHGAKAVKAIMDEVEAKKKDDVIPF